MLTTILSTANNDFVSSFIFLIHDSFVSCLTTLARLPSTTLNRAVTVGILFMFPIFYMRQHYDKLTVGYSDFFPSLVESKPLGLLEYITAGFSVLTWHSGSFWRWRYWFLSPWYLPCGIGCKSSRSGHSFQRLVLCWARRLRGRETQMAQEYNYLCSLSTRGEKNLILSFQRYKSGEKRYHSAPGGHFFPLWLLEGWHL